MAQSSRPKKGNKGDKKKDAAKQAAIVQRKKGKSKGATKFHTEELRSMLDNDASTLYTIHQKTAHTPTQIIPNTPAEPSIADLVNTLGNL